MMAGLPGTGIGGMFYLVTALAMPLREAYRRAGGGSAVSGTWRLVAGQTAIAGGILGGVWATGWLLGVALRAAAPVVPLPPASHPGNVLRTVTFALSLGTLAAVLLGVELLRLWVHRPADRRAAIEPHEERQVVAVAGGGRVGRIVVLVLTATAVPTRAAVAQSGSPVAAHLARADSAFAEGDAAAAAREYAVVLAADPENSHATYRLAQLRRHDPTGALQLLRRYVALEPSDPWGYMAVAEVLARTRRYEEALRWYDDALRLAPAERDAVVGRARILVRARRTGAAIAVYERWLAAHPMDAEAGRELAAARVAAAPAVTPLVSGSRDSDGNTTLRLGGAAELAASGPTRVGVAASRERVQDGVTATGLEELTLRAASRPRAALQLDAAAGATRLDGSDGHGVSVIPTAQVRARWRAPLAGPAVDLRAARSVLDASPLLVANRVTRTELGATVELPVAGSFKLRGIGRAAALSDSAAVNHRTTVAAVAAFAATPSVELSGQFHEVRYSHATTAGYFAPRLIQVVEAGSYFELETSRSILFAFDIGAGVQRVAEQGAALGPWRRALRLYSLIVVPLAPGRDLKLELDSEDSAVAEAATTARWRYISMGLSLRWAVP